MTRASPDSAVLAESIALVQTFMHHLAARDLAAASALLAAGFTLTTTGGLVFRELGDFVALSRGRNRAVRKHDTGLDACFLSEDEHGPQVAVYVFGTLSGEWLDGTSFRDVRYLDRFVVLQGKIAVMDIYSDMAEHRARQG